MIKVKQIIDYYYNPSTDIIEVRFRISGDPETEMRESEFEISTTKDYGYLIIDSDSYESEDLNFDYEEETDELILNDNIDEFSVDKKELRNFLSEYYTENPSELPELTSF
jgi:hypothetical protein